MSAHIMVERSPRRQPSGKKGKPRFLTRAGRLKFEKVMNEKGLKSSSGHPVTDPAQRVAIAISEGRSADKGKRKKARR